MSRIRELLQRPDVQLTPTSEPVIAALCKKLTWSPPRTLLELWREGGSLALSSLDAEILGPAELLRDLEENDWVARMLAQGLLPFYDDHQSNYLAVHLRSPLAGRVRAVPHDSDSGLVYRSFDRFVDALLAGLDTPDFTSDSFGLESDDHADYKVNGPRTEEDLQAARALLATDNAQEEWTEAIPLLSPDNTAEWKFLLDKGDYVHRCALAWLQQFDLPWVRELLEREQSEFGAWMNRLAEACRAAGWTVKRKDSNLMVDEIWLNLPVFYERRHARDAMPRTILWISDLLAKRHPYHRADHLMID